MCTFPRADPFADVTEAQPIPAKAFYTILWPSPCAMRRVADATAIAPWERYGLRAVIFHSAVSLRLPGMCTATRSTRSSSLAKASGPDGV